MRKMEMICQKCMGKRKLKPKMLYVTWMIDHCSECDNVTEVLPVIDMKSS